MTIMMTGLEDKVMDNRIRRITICDSLMITKDQFNSISNSTNKRDYQTKIKVIAVLVFSKGFATKTRTSITV